MVAVGGAWPLLVTLTPAADRPWISGTSDNSIWSLIFGYNGLGRVAGQTGGPGGGGPGGGGFGGNNLFGGATGPFRLLQSALGDQAGWLLGFAVVAGLAILVLTRLRRRDPRTGWLIAVGGAFLDLGGRVQLRLGHLPPLLRLVPGPVRRCAGRRRRRADAAALARRRGRRHCGTAAVIAPLAIAAGVVTELVVLGELTARSAWARPLIIGVAGAAAVILALELPRRVRAASWSRLPWPRSWPRRPRGQPTRWATPPAARSRPADRPAPQPAGQAEAVQAVPGSAAARRAAAASEAAGRRVARSPAPSGGFAPPQSGGAGGIGTAHGSAPRIRSAAAARRRARPGGFGGDSASLTAAIRYVKQHGGGAIGVSSQSSAAAAILNSNADVAGLGGFSGRESSVSATWLAQEVAAGRLRWVIVDGTQAGGLPGDTRTGSQAAMSVVASTCRRVTLSTSGSTATMYDCQGRAAAILQAARG